MPCEWNFAPPTFFHLLSDSMLSVSQNLLQRSKGKATACRYEFNQSDLGACVQSLQVILPGDTPTLAGWLFSLCAMY